METNEILENYKSRYYNQLFANMHTKCICGLEHNWVEDFSRKNDYDTVITPVRCKRCNIKGLYYERD